ncbi:DNA cytosine methyltransferase [Shewanella algae]|uniref:DNA cytosine methyltransferase n=1 Tax=Shewanella algae TaxID=38313 RepID=UPI0031F51324
MSAPTFIDLFSGCGGLSLGLLSSGWRGILAVERTPDAFTTYKHNLIESHRFDYDWPTWLPCTEIDIDTLINQYSDKLASLKNSIDLIAGGPPCQGFSPAGRRNPNDPRNKMAVRYIQIVKMIRPKMLLLENVRGFNVPFNDPSKGEDSIPYSEVVKQQLEAIGYNVEFKVVVSAQWGVPQLRPRFILIATRSDLGMDWKPFKLLDSMRGDFLQERGLNPDKPVTAKQALDDLKLSGKKLIDCTDTDRKGFKQIQYRSPRGASRFVKLMRKGMKPNHTPNSLRIPRHTSEVADRFAKILAESPKGKTLSPEIRAKFKLKKHTITPLCPNRPAATITTLPDDILHYEEPRIPTVREMARLQSFPDWFEFLGRYTTGGKARKEMCPRYTQVGNAVPPLLGEALGQLLYCAVGNTHSPRHQAAA